MKVVLRAAVAGLGKRGDIIDVSTGHARNFLIPQALAIPATPRHRGPGRFDAPLSDVA